MRFIPAPRHLSAHALGVTVLRTAQAQQVVTPAHALAIFTLVHRGALQGSAQTLNAGTLAGLGSAGTARITVAGPGTVCASLLCRASVLPLLTGEPASQFANGTVVPALLGLDADALHKQLGDAPSDASLAAALFGRLSRALSAARAPRSSALRFAAALAHGVRETHGVYGVQGALARPPVGWSERQWQRACQAELGVTPVFLQRLARLHASVRARLSHDTEPLSQHALRAGFFDQAHMAREYRLLAGAAPRECLVRAADAATGMALGASQLAPRFYAR